MSALRNALRDLPGPVFADLLESDTAYLLVVDVPGVSEETIDVTIEGPRLRIEARREKEFPHEYRYRQEDRPLFLDAELLVPADAAGEGASATIDRGTLELRLPKRDHDDTAAVPIAVGQHDDANSDNANSDDANQTAEIPEETAENTTVASDASASDQLGSDADDEPAVIGTDAIDTIEDSTDDTADGSDDTDHESDDTDDETHTVAEDDQPDRTDGT